MKFLTDFLLALLAFGLGGLFVTGLIAGCSCALESRKLPYWSRMPVAITILTVGAALAWAVLRSVVPLP